jgi:hypothetical protein
MRRVAVLIESSRAYGRSLLRGVARYNREHGRWSVYLQPHGLDHPPPRWLNRWRGDGILVRIGDRRMLRAVLAAGLPTVDLRGVVPDFGVPFIGVANRAVADMAADHLMERGLRHFGFCGLPAGVHPHLDERRRFFTARIEQFGYEVHFYEARAEQSTPWDREQKRMAAWIRSFCHRGPSCSGNRRTPSPSTTPRLPRHCATSAATLAKASALTTCSIRSTYRGVCWSGDSIALSVDRPRPRSFASSSSERSSCSPRATFRSMWWPANRGSETVAICAMSLPERR